MNYIILITMLFCGPSWGLTYTTVKQTAAQAVPVTIESAGFGVAGLDSSDVIVSLSEPGGALSTMTMTSALWLDRGRGNYDVLCTLNTVGRYILLVTDSFYSDTVQVSDTVAPCAVFRAGKTYTGKTVANYYNLCFTSGLNAGQCYPVGAVTTNAGGDTITLDIPTDQWWVNNGVLASHKIRVGDDFILTAGEWQTTISVTDSASGGGGGADTADIKLALAPIIADTVRTALGDTVPAYSGADTAAIRAMMLTAKIQRADTTGVAETLLAGGSTGSDTTNIKAALATAHGAGSWLTATGFAVPGSAMALTTAERDSLDNRQHVQAKKDTIKHVTEIGDDDNIATKVWSFGSRTLTTFSLLTAFDIWTYATRTLTPTGNAQIAESTWTHSPRTLTAGSGSDTTAIGTMLDNRYGINDSTLRTQGVSALGSNLLTILALSTTDSTPIGGVLATVSDLAFSAPHTWAETNVSGLVRFSLAPDTVGLTGSRPTYGTAIDTQIVTGPVTDTLWLAPPPVPIPTSPGRCTVWGDVYNLGTTPSNPRYQVTAYVQPGEQPQYSDSAAVSTNKVLATADSTGRWSLELLQGVKIQIEIPVAGVRRVGTVPASTTANYLSFTAPR